MISNYKNIKIITTYKIYGADKWDESVDFIDLPPKQIKHKNKILYKLTRIKEDLSLIVSFFLARGQYDILVTNSERSGNLFAIFQGIFGKKIHHVMVNCFWNYPPNNLFKFFRQIYFKFVSKGVDKFIVFTPHEIESYHAIFNIPKDKMAFIHMYVTPLHTNCAPTKGNYIFSAGNPHNRDFPTLLNAVNDLSIRVKIVTQTPEYFFCKKIPPNVEILSLTKDGFFDCMAGSKLVIVVLKKGEIRSAGQRTYLDAMYLGKPVIVCDDKGAFNYITNGEDGIIVPSADVVSLKNAIIKLLSSEENMNNIAQKAQIKAKEFTVDKTMLGILTLIEEVVNKK